MDGAAHSALDACKVAHNAAGVSGGGVFCTGNTSIALVGGLVVNNTAGSTGGGIGVFQKAQLRIQGGTSLAHNRVTDPNGCCGGVHLVSTNFTLEEVVHAVHDNAAANDANIGVVMSNITILGNTSILGYANRFSENEGMLHVTVKLSGYYGLPCQGRLAQAVLADGTFLAANRLNEWGKAYVSFKVMRPPGHYVVSVFSPDVTPAPSANLTLQIRSCIRGEVAPTPITCQPCQEGYFSFDPHAVVCDSCPANANCTGGNAIVPVPGYWRSSASSNQVHRCAIPKKVNLAAYGVVFVTVMFAYNVHGAYTAKRLNLIGQSSNDDHKWILHAKCVSLSIPADW